jgi:hypothetical protein
MAAKPAVQVVITGDTKGLERSLKKSGGMLDGFGKTALGVFGGLAIAKGVGLAVDGIKALGGFAMEGVEKLDALGDSVARLDGLAKGLGDAVTAADLTKFGVDKGEAAAAALALAKTGKSLKLTDKQLASATPKLTEMAAQLASLGDGDPEKQAELLAKALGGSAKAAKALGVVLPKGKDVTPMETYAALVEQLAPQLDEATSGTASLADVGDRWDATLANIQLELAGFLEQLAPVVSTLMDVLMPLLKEFVDTVGPLVAGVFAAIGEAVSGFLAGGSGAAMADVFGSIMSVLEKVGTFIAETVIPTLLNLATAIGEQLAPLLPPIRELFAALMPVIDALFPVLERVWMMISANLVPVIKVLLPIVVAILGIIIKLATALLRVLAPALDAAVALFDDLVAALKPVFTWLDNILDIAGDVVGKLNSIKLPSLPFSLAAPAPASFAAGPAQLAAPAINVTIQTGVGDPVAIGRTVARYLDAWTQRGGAVPGGAATVARVTGRARLRPA